MNRLKIFLSYSTVDKKLAAALKHKLEEYGLDVFLAHEDIEPSSEWSEKILIELKGCHVFIPILTENFRESKWTDQETGVAIALNKLVIPLKIKDDPHGFISRIQALKIESDDITGTCSGIIKIISSQHRFRIKMKNLLIKIFSTSGGWMEAEQNTKLLFSLGEFTDRQINLIVRYAVENDQIYNSYGAQAILKNFVRKHGDKIKSQLLDKFKIVFRM